MSLEGSQLGRYHLLQLLGRGAMGEVYLAEDVGINRQVAIKVIRSDIYREPALDTTSEALRLFQHEMRTIARLNHPHILPLFDYGETTIHETLLPYMVMPFCQDGSLAAWLKQRGTPAILSPQEVAHMVQQAAAALQYAHDQYIVHRDVKPSNFLIRRNQENPNCPELLLADFGLARLTSASSSQSLTIGGTPPYMAPEQWRGHPVPATDQYMLAIMTYELLTGRTPFRGSLERLLVQHLQEPPEPPGSFNSQIPDMLNSVVLKALAKQPEARFPSVSRFARAFDQALQEDSRSLAHNPDVTIGVNVPLPLPTKGSSGKQQVQEAAEFPSGERVSIWQRVSALFSRSNFLLLCGIILLLGVSGSGILFFVKEATSVPSPVHTVATGTGQTSSVSSSITKTYPSRNNKLVLSDPLRNNSHGYNWDEGSNNCEFSQDGYHVRTEVIDYTFYCNAFATDFANFAYEVQMRILKGDSGGVVFHANGDNSTFYYFRVAPNGYYRLIISTGHGPETILDAGQASGFHTGPRQANLLAVVCNGSRIELFANHTYIASVTNDTYKHGQIGVAATTGDGGPVEVIFSDAKLWQL